MEIAGVHGTEQRHGAINILHGILEVENNEEKYLKQYARSREIPSTISTLITG